MLRAYDAENGDVLWQFDTSREFAAVNGTATGGSIGGPGPAIGSGAVIVNSGYDFGDHMPGNALLIFTPGGR
jgi:polyvinyl alcohol dehydrogenase (cytochrome)